MTFDRISRRFEKPKPIALEPPSEGDPCPDPKCDGRMTRGYIVTWRARETGAMGQSTVPFPLAKIEKFCADNNRENRALHHLPRMTDRFLCDACGWKHGKNAHAG